MGGGSGDERRALRHDVRHILGIETRHLTARMDMRGEGEGGTEDD